MKKQINIHHFKRYKKFIQSRVQHTPNTYTENHHIIPKSISKNNNTIQLSAKEHYIAHKILTKVFVKNTKHWFSMAKAFNAMFVLSKGTKERSVNSNDFALRRKLNAESMKYNNPMKNPETVKKMKSASKKSWTQERRDKQSLMASNRKLPQSAKDKLSKMWMGVPKPKKEGQVDKNIKASSCGLFITPFGVFDSPGQAARSPLNENQHSRYIINKLCKANEKGYEFKSNGKVETRGHWKKHI